MKLSYTLCLLWVVICFSSIAQVKPAMPANYFEKFSYVLPANFNMTDSQQVSAEIRKMATSLHAFLQSAENNYTIDSNNRYTISSNMVVPAATLGKFSLALQAIKTTRNLKPGPAYRAPFGIIHEAWSNASIKHASKPAVALSVSLQQEFKSVINSLNHSFRDDIVNAMKGGYAPEAAQKFLDDMKDVVDQAVSKSNSKLNFRNTAELLDFYFRYNLLKQYQPDIEALLYQISPARVQSTDVMIPMRDGVKLSAFVFRNVNEKEKLPAVVSLSPYPSGNEYIRGNVFATNGYIYVYVDNRGRNKSEGEFFPYEDDARDFYDVIDWVSKQPWCNGKVATSGGSYLGFTQWQAIRKNYRHPALKAINPMVSVGFGIDFPRVSNLFYAYCIRWAEFVSGKDPNDARFLDSEFWDKTYFTLYKNRLPYEKLDSVAGRPNPFFQKWISHPDFDEYWKSILPSQEDYAALDLPVLTITGYYDADQLGAFYYFDNHHKYASAAAASKHYMLIGPYDHGGAQWQPSAVQAGLDLEKEAQIPIYKYAIWWYDWVLKGKKKPAFLQNKINYFVTGTGKWASGESFKKITRDTMNLFLSPALVKNPKRKELFLLDTHTPTSVQSLKYSHDIALVKDSAFLFQYGNPFDDSLYMTSPYNMVFESKPLEKDIILSDKVTAQLYMSLNVPDADFFMNVSEVDAAGKSYDIAYAMLRSRYRNGGDKPELMKPGQVALHNFDQAFLYVKKIRKGSKLRLAFEILNTPVYQKNYGFGGNISKETTDKPRVIEATIHTGPGYPSRIVVPYTTEAKQ